MRCPGHMELVDDGQGVGEGECGVKEEVLDGRGGEGENQIWCTVHTSWDTSWDAVDTRCLAGQVNYTIDLQL